MPSGPSEEKLARAILRGQANPAVVEIAFCERAELEELLDEMIDLPDQALALMAPLPPILTPALERMARAVADDDDEGIEAALGVVLPAYDTGVTRAPSGILVGSTASVTASVDPWPVRGGPGTSPQGSRVRSGVPGAQHGPCSGVQLRWWN